MPFDTPASRFGFLGRLSLKTKVTLVGLLGALPAIVLLVVLTRWQGQLLRSCDQERAGLAYLRQCQAVLDACALGLNQSDPKAAQQTGAALKKLDELQVKAAARFKNAQAYQDFQSAVISFVQHGDTQNGDWLPLGAALQKAGELEQSVAENSGLIVDPDVQGYYLRQAALGSVPRLQQDMLQVMGLGTIGRFRKADSLKPDALALLSGLQAEEEARSTALEAACQRPGGEALRSWLKTGEADLKAAHQAFLGSLASAAGRANFPAGLQSPLLAALTVGGVQACCRFNGLALEAVHNILEARAAGLEAARWSGLLAVLALLAAAALLGMRVAGSILGPVRTLKQACQAILQRGDLSQKIPVTSGDELGELAGYFARMVEKLRTIPLELSQSVKQLSQALEELGRAAESQSQMMTRQAAALQQTQVTAQEIKQTALVAAQRAGEVLQLSQRADEIRQTGEGSVDLSLEGLMQVRGQVEAISQRITELSERTDEVTEITETVKDLADQSNMLALNAAIEAVRSGEHGKGFALVAREIRSLADQSIQATKRVRQILANTHEAIRRAVTSSEHGTQRIEAGLVQPRTSGENLRALAGIVKEHNESVRQIATAISQQSAGISQIFSAVSDQNRMMDESVRQLNATLGTVQELKAVFSTVSEVVSQYKV